MSNLLKLKTLTPVHVGTGIDFQGNVEYLWFSNERQAVVLDDEKALDIIGEENIGHWVSCIEKGEPLLTLLQQRRAGLRPEMVARRILRHGAGAIEAQKVLREQLHSANGSPLLPGSSLKGALRTAVWAEQIFQQPELVKEPANLGETRTDRRSGKEHFEFKDSALSQKIFGKDPNHDVFRLWQIGDAMFQQPTAIYRTEVVNFYRDEYDIKKEITQQIEAIPAGAETQTRWNYNDLLEKRAGESNLLNRTAEALPPERLFPAVNKHTKRLLENEIKFWKEDAHLPLVLGTYADDLERMLAEVNACDAQSFVMRLGWGTGFRTMTGDWHINMTDDDYYDLVAALRPTHDETVQYPKTTRMVAGGTPLGFIKLTLQA